ncbi:MAG: SOS response-associated peptidase [Dehalococcoidia bacterium]
MCGRFTLTPENVELVAASLGIAPSDVFEERYIPRWNIAPMQEHWIARLDHEERAVTHATWGLVNWWEPSRREGAKHINARAETIESRRPFRDAFQATRCIVPADGFFEWVGEEHERRPFWFHRPDRGVFAFAGLYVEARLHAEAAPMTTFTIITTTANATVAPIHDRMPVILADDDAMEQWLYPRQPANRLHALLRPAADALLVATAVSTRVNSVLHDDPACLDEAEPETQGTLL